MREILQYHRLSVFSDLTSQVISKDSLLVLQILFSRVKFILLRVFNALLIEDILVEVKLADILVEPVDLLSKSYLRHLIIIKS